MFGPKANVFRVSSVLLASWMENMQSLGQVKDGLMEAVETMENQQCQQEEDRRCSNMGLLHTHQIFLNLENLLSYPTTPCPQLLPFFGFYFPHSFCKLN